MLAQKRKALVAALLSRSQGTSSYAFMSSIDVDSTLSQNLPDLLMMPMETCIK